MDNNNNDTNQSSNSSNPGDNMIWQNNSNESGKSPDPNNSENTTYFQGEQNQMFTGATDTNSNSYVIQEPKKSKKGIKIALSLVIVALLIGGAFFAINSSAKIKNTLALTTKNPEEYYLSIEKANRDNMVEPLLEAYDKYFEALNNDNNKASEAAYDLTLNLKLNKMITSLIDLDGLDLSSMQADISTDLNEEKGLIKLNLSLNKTSVISTNVYMDIKQGIIYVQVPELNNDYLMFSFDDLGLTQEFLDEYYSELDSIKETMNEVYIDTKDLKTLISTYSDIILENLKVTDLEKGVKLKSQGVSAKVTKITTTINTKAIYAMMDDVLDTAKNDKIILSLLEQYGDMTKAEAKDSLDLLLEELEYGKDDFLSDKTKINMYVYVDNAGNIVGRTFSLKPDTITSTGNIEFGYYIVKDGSEYGYEAYIQDETGEKIFELAGDAEKSNDGYTGSFECSITTESIEDQFYNDDWYDDDYYDDEWLDITSFKVDFKDVKSLNDEFAQGKITISSPTFSGMSLFIELNSDGKSYQDYTFGVLSGKTELGAVTLQLKKSKFDDFKMPDTATNNIYNGMTDELYDYIYNIDYEAFINDLSQKLGVDLMELIGDYYY